MEKTARHVNQWSKTEDPHMSTGSYRHLILTDMSKIHSREKIATSKTGTGKTGCQHIE